MRNRMRNGIVLGLFCGMSVHAQDSLWNNDVSHSSLTYSLRHPMHVVEGKSQQVACSVEVKTDDTVHIDIQIAGKPRP
jgi:hypothetical protein